MSSYKSWFKGLRGKLFFSAILPIIAFVALTTVSIKSVNSLGDMLSNAYTKLIPSMDALGDMGMQRARVGYFIWAALAAEQDEVARDKFLTRVSSAFDDFKKAQTEYEANPFTPEEEANYAKARAEKQAFYDKTDLIISLLKKKTPEANAEIYKSMNFGDWHKMAITVQDAIAANMKLYGELSASGNKIQAEERTHLTQLLVLISLFCALTLFSILMWIAYRVSTSVGAIAEGLGESGSQVSSAITQLTSAGQTLSESSTEAAASLEETVASLEEMSSMVKMNSDNAKQAAALSISSRESAELGQGEIQSLIASMHDISQSSKKIEEIISVIDDIAFQTNLLALNAAVEAARAGEQGKGFAVVAEAVRALAQRSASAAKDINVLIKDSVEKVEKGSSIADKSGEVLANIVNSVKKVSDLNNEISAASSEQTSGIQQISKAMNQLDQGSQANAASSEEIAASAEEIDTQAKHMARMVENLGAVIFGSTQAPPPPVAAKAPPKAGKPAPESKVVPFKPKAKPVAKAAAAPSSKKAQSSSDLIPFDEDDSRAKVGTTDGF